MAERSIDAQIAEHQAKIARLRQKKEKDRTREKILVGSSYIGLAEKDPNAAQRMIDHLEKIDWRETDKKIISGLTDRLRKVGQ